jgi:hypothetical protein
MAKTTNSVDHRQYIAGCRAVVCIQAHGRWDVQKDCDGSVKDPLKDKCWYSTYDGICNRDRMEHEGA